VEPFKDRVPTVAATGAPTQPRRSAGERAAQQLRQEILECGEGTLLGSEDELMKQFGISRPTLRQTARLLEHEQPHTGAPIRSLSLLYLT